jgi:beta-phosphoglucomutase
MLFAVSTGLDPGLAFLFDLDGVLINSMPIHTEAWKVYLKRLGVPQEYLEERMHGKRNSELVRDLIGANLSEDAVYEHGAAKERLFREMILEGGLSRYQIPGLIEFLGRYRGVPMAVGSNAEPRNIDFVLDRLQLREFFPITVDGSQVERAKPFPDVYLRAADLLKVRPANCIVFEDSPAGVGAGVAAGMRVVGVETTPTAFEGVAYQVKDFLDPGLDEWLRKQRPES